VSRAIRAIATAAIPAETSEIETAATRCERTTKPSPRVRSGKSGKKLADCSTVYPCCAMPRNQPESQRAKASKTKSERAPYAANSGKPPRSGDQRSASRVAAQNPTRTPTTIQKGRLDEL
jgi:hypothetical protein